MASGKKGESIYQKVRVSKKPKRFPGITLDLEKLLKKYGNEEGCKVRICIMEDGDEEDKCCEHHCVKVVPKKTYKGKGKGRGKGKS